MEPDQSTFNDTAYETTFTIELVWDANNDATAIPVGLREESSALHVGPRAGWLSTDLVMVAVASSFMDTLLRLAEAAGVSIFGYVSSCKLHVSSDDRRPPVIALTPCMVVGSPEHARRVGDLCQQAVQRSDVCRTVRQVRVTPDTHVITRTDNP